MVVCWLVSLSVDWEVRKSLVGFFYGFFSGRTFTQGLKITGEKHAGNLGVGESIAPKSCALVPCA